jgi:hypothetical protein
MSLRLRALFTVAFFLSVSLAIAKKKVILPAFVLSARTVYVMIDPDTGISVTDPLGDRKALDDVERALLSWGRLKPVMDRQTADLIIVIHKGSNQPVTPTIGRSTSDRPIIVQETDSSIRLGGQKGRPPGSPDPSQNPRPAPGAEVSSTSEDTFMVYLGGLDISPERGPVWRYLGKNALRSPDVRAVSEFRKIVEEAEKDQQQQKQQQKKKP